MLDFNTIEEICGVTIKDSHTIVEQWPLRLKLQPHQAGAQDEFKILLASDHCGHERYVEWKKS